MNLFKQIRGKGALKNIAHLYSSQLISLIFSILLSLYIPKFIGVEEFSYWQLFLFYANYTGLLQLGLNDGIYLRFGGKELSLQEYSSVSAQLRLVAITITILSGILILLLLGNILSIKNINYKFIYVAVAFFAIINNIYGFCGSVLQSQNRFKIYSNTFIIDRMIMGCLLIIMIVLSITDFKYIVICWIASLTIVTIRVLIKNKDLFLRKTTIGSSTFKEAGINIKVGINLMLSSISGMLIIGICRYFINLHYPIKVFGYVSFSLSLILFCLLFISKIGIGIYPILKKQSNDFHPIFFKKMDNLLTYLLPLTILLFPILNIIVRYFLPHYYPSLLYLAIFFPLGVFTAKIDMLYSTYLKVLRKERKLLKVNLFTMLLSTLLSGVCIFLFDNVEWALICVSGCIILKAAMMQSQVSRAFKISYKAFYKSPDYILCLAYLILLGTGINFNILIVITIIVSIFNILVHRTQIQEDFRFFLINRK